MKRSRFAVDFLSEGDVIVRGTTDPMQALEWAVGELDDCNGGPDIYGVEPNDDEDPDPAAVAAMAAWCHTMLTSARPGYYRKVHCLENSYGAFEGWGWTLSYAKGPARGAFQGVYFRGY